MASNPDKKPDKKKATPPSGVRGPGGPPPPPARSSSAAGKGGARPAPSKSPARPKSERRQSFERLSYPAIRWLNGLPRWLVVILPALLLFLGLIQTGSLAWVGGVLLIIVSVLLAWLTALSWPAITPGSRILRVVVVAALIGIAGLKFLGRF